MPLRYACFISYQRGNDVVDRFARELFQSLSNELGLVTSLPVWFDTRIDVGTDWNEGIVSALASSVCLVPILTPTYFSSERSYCTREFLGMKKLQEARETLTHRYEPLIIPVVLRGRDRLPKAVQEYAFYDFSDYLAFGPKQFRSRRFAQSIGKLSATIADLCDSYAGMKQLDQLDASTFALPSEQETHDWLGQAESVARLPRV
jgi:hypothetical protein